jgi:hypothetical protein
MAALWQCHVVATAGSAGCDGAAWVLAVQCYILVGLLQVVGLLESYQQGVGGQGMVHTHIYEYGIIIIGRAGVA